MIVVNGIKSKVNKQILLVNRLIITIFANRIIAITTMTQIHYKSDFDFIFELEGGFPTFNFGGKITSGVSEAVYFTFNCISKKCKNCFNDNGKIHVVCDKHGLPPGKLMLELYAYLPNSLYPDGERTIV